MLRYFIIYKPYQVLSQFTSTEQKQSLKDWFKVPPDVYPVGRLDYDSEGLLILTNDKQLNHRLLSPAHEHQREYWVQVEGEAMETHLQKLRQGVDINVDAKLIRTKKAIAEFFDEAPGVPERTPPIRFRKSIPTSWLRLCITEGKNRQVRRMTAAVGLPTLRLIRYRIEKISIEGMNPGDLRELQANEIHDLLFS